MFRRPVLKLLASSALLIPIAGISHPQRADGQQSTATPASSAGFTVNVTYSQKASSALAAGKETVVVAGYLYGFPLQGTPKKYVDHMGQISVGDDIKQEISPGAIATFSTIKFDEAMLKWMDSRGPQIVINVYSGRKSSPNNLLDCGFYEGPLKAIQGTSLPISCKLIGE
jgi:hypothetical protein